MFFWGSRLKALDVCAWHTRKRAGSAYDSAYDSAIIAAIVSDKNSSVFSGLYEIVVNWTMADFVIQVSHHVRFSFCYCVYIFS